MILPPGVTLTVLRTVGVEIRPSSVRYAALHRGVHVKWGRLFLDADTQVVAYSGRLGRTILAAAPCSWLKDGRCEHYKQRPSECREFDEATAQRYVVLMGCRYDTGGLGEDVSEVVRLSKENDHAVAER
jgi:hypothetical protein